MHIYTHKEGKAAMHNFKCLVVLGPLGYNFCSKNYLLWTLTQYYQVTRSCSKASGMWWNL